MAAKKQKTTVGVIDSKVLSFTVGRDPELDLFLAESDCIGTAAHVTMLSKMRIKPKVLTAGDCKKIITELRAVMRSIKKGSFKITVKDQDVHMAVERILTKKLGELGRRVHTARSRNDQCAVDLKLFSRGELLKVIQKTAELAEALIKFAARHRDVPVAGRTHMQPAMPSSIGLWASAYGESLLDDIGLLMSAYDLNDQSPLGAAAGYGVSLPIDRELTADLLGFSRPAHNVMHAMNSRGKCESVILFAMSQVMLTLSRLSTDMILYSMPEFGYISLPAPYCTGSSIMPQKRNPDVLELIRAKSATVMSKVYAVTEITRALPGGYNRDLQETKAPLIDGIAETLASVSIMIPVIKKTRVNRKACKASLTAEVFATDVALACVVDGMPFRDAYNFVKAHLGELEELPLSDIEMRNHLGAPGGLDFDGLIARAKVAEEFVADERKTCSKAISKLLGIKYRI